MKLTYLAYLTLLIILYGCAYTKVKMLEDEPSKNYYGERIVGSWYRVLDLYIADGSPRVYKLTFNGDGTYEFASNTGTANKNYSSYYELDEDTITARNAYYPTERYLYKIFDDTLKLAYLPVNKYLMGDLQHFKGNWYGKYNEAWHR